MLVPLVSLLCSGPSVSDLAPGCAVLGRPTWDAGMLLAQLELRLGLPRPASSEVARLQRHSQRLAELSDARERFYSRSYAADPLGTTRLLLEWRDELVLAGWDGACVAGGGERLETLAELEAGHVMADVAPGLPERVRAVERELAASQGRVFEGLDLAEDLELWPELWRQVFARLQHSGTVVSRPRVSFPEARANSDLARVQALLRGHARAGFELTGDGSIVVIEAETSWELAQACAAVLRSWAPSSAVVVRGADAAALDAAFVAQKLPSQGVWSRSTWRPALQVLPLALELAFEPRDPQRVLELVTLREGPFEGRMGRELARALTEAPGIGGRPWRTAKQRLRDAGVEGPQLSIIAAWLEGPAHAALLGAPRSALHEVAERVRQWLTSELSRAHSALAADPNDSDLATAVARLGAAFGQVEAFQQGLAHERRERLRLVEVRQLLDEAVGAPHAIELAAERAGRFDHVPRPAGVRAPRDVVLWWYCEAETELRAPLPPWRAAEIAALEATGVRLIDVTRRLAAEAQSWHQPILAARQRLILALPRSGSGRELAPHPILDELAGRLGDGRSALNAVRLDARELLHAGGERLALLDLDHDSVADLGPRRLPEARPEWVIDPARLAIGESQAASTVEALVQCPLKWTLGQCAGLRRSSRFALPSGTRLNGMLGHRLIEELQLAGVLSDPARIDRAAREVFDRLVAEEAAVLLLAGGGSEVTQLRLQLCDAVGWLTRWLAASKLEVVSVEAETRGEYRDCGLNGRIDLLLRNASGREVVVDAKWGASRYATLLQRGQALQLATYARLRQLDQPGSAAPRTAYFSLSAGKLLSTDVELAGEDAIRGEAWPETWRRLDATIGLVQVRLARGHVSVTGVKRSLPLSSALDLPANDADDYLELAAGSGCEYCDYAPVCGRSWEEHP